MRFAHQAAACIVFGNLRDRTSHVDVDDVGAEALDDLGGVSHDFRIAAEDLNRDRPFLFREFRVLQRAIDAANSPPELTISVTTSPSRRGA
jgi:hypothetical protein